MRGGFTTIACMPNTKPALDDPAVLAQLGSEIAREARCRVYPIAAVTRGRHGVDSATTSARGAGAIAFSDDGDTVKDGDVMRAAALRARNLRAPVIAHCVPEDEIVARDLAIAAETGKAVARRASLDRARARTAPKGARAGERR